MSASTGGIWGDFQWHSDIVVLDSSHAGTDRAIHGAGSEAPGGLIKSIINHEFIMMLLWTPSGKLDRICECGGSLVLDLFSVVHRVRMTGLSHMSPSDG